METLLIKGLGVGSRYSKMPIFAIMSEVSGKPFLTNNLVEKKYQLKFFKYKKAVRR